MKKILLIFCVLFLWTCGGGGGGGPTEPEGPTYVVELTSLAGQAQKGPFSNGTAINIAELNNTLSPTGRNFSTAIIDNSGRFSVANVQLESPYVELRANGFYFNEISNNLSEAQLTLFALSNLSGKTSLNVNILTHLEKNRMTTLMGNPDNPKTFAQAKVQAQEEVFAIFDYSRANVPESELLDISQGGSANAKLLAISAIVQGDLTVGQMSELLANISTDIANDGTLDNATLRNTLIDNSKNLDLAQIRTNLEARYASLGISANIPDFETEVNQFLKPPVANDISVSTDEDTQINVTLDASDPENESLTFSTIEVNNATVTINGNVANYVPDAHFNGTDTFTYKANDGTSDSNIATVTVTVNAIDDEPNTNDISTTTDEDVSVTLTLTADEYDGQNYSFSIISNPSNGTATLSGATVTYAPNQDWNGTDTFTFEATDDRTAKTNVATATITVNAVNDAPIANDITNQVTDENRMMQLDITLDATDVDGDALTYNIASTNNGSVTINDNIATYVPNQDWNGEDTFTYYANDGIVDSNNATVTITVNSIPDAPVAVDISSSIDEDWSGHTVTIVGTGGNDSAASDADDDNLTFLVVSPPSNGSIYNDAGGGVPDGNALVAGDQLTSAFTIYNPNANYNGTDTFTFKANDGALDSNIGTVTITVNSVNDAPTATDVSANSNEDEVVTYDLSSIVSDVDGDQLTYTVSSQPGDGTTSISGSILTYTPNADYNGSDTSNWSVSDGIATITKGFTAIVAPVNDAPIAYDFSKNVDEDSEITFALRETSPGSNTGTDNEGGVYDPDIETDQDDDITFSIVTQPSNGTAELITNNDIKYTPNANFNGTDTFTYKGNDGALDSNVATISMIVSSVNDAPVATDANDTSTSIDEDTADNKITITGSDVDGDDITYILVSGPSNGSLASFPTNAFSTPYDALYTPNQDWNGIDTFTYKVNDGSLDSNTATATITVNPTYGDEDNDITTTDFASGIIRETSSGTYINSHYDEGITEFDENLNVLRTFESSETQADAAYEIKELSSGGFNVVLDCNSSGGIRLLQLDSGFNQQFITDCYMPDDFKGWGLNAILLDNDEMVVVYDGYKDNGDENTFVVHYNTDGSIKRSVATNMTDTSVGILKDSNGFTLIGYDNAMKFDLDGNVTQAITNWASSLSNTVASFSMYSHIINSSDGGYVVAVRTQPSSSRGGDLNFSNKKELFSDINNRSMDTDSGILLVKLNSDLSIAWETLANKNSHYEAPRGTLLQDSDGSYYITGGIRTSDSGYFWASLLKFDSSGNLEFYKEYGESDGDYNAVKALLRDPVFDQFNILSKRYVTDPDSIWLIKVDKDGTRTARTY